MRIRLVPGRMVMARLPLLPADNTSFGEGLLAEGLFLASRDLDVTDGSTAARAGYALRARTRATPHGVWASASTARLEAGEPLLLLGEAHRCITLPGPGWLAAVADPCLDLPGVLEKLHLSANPLTARRGNVLEAEHPAADGTGQLGSARLTEVSGLLMQECDRRGGMPAGELLDAVLSRWPRATPAMARDVVLQLIRTGLLLTDLLPPDPADDPLGHLASRLPHAAPLRTGLLNLRESITQADRHRPGAPERLPLLRTARRTADTIHAARRALTCDTIADAQLRLPPAVGAAAARAVEVLWRISHRTPPLQGWTATFRKVYGPHRMVPLLEAVDPVHGIGPPDPLDEIGARSDLEDRRAQALLALLAEATARGRHTVELTEETVLMLSHLRDAIPPRTAEVHVTVLRDPRGHLTLAVGPHSAQEAGSAAGRFLRHLPRLTPEPVPEDDGGAVRAEIVCRPLTTSTAALTAAGGREAHRIPVGLPLAHDGDLDPRTLLVTTTRQGHLALYSPELDRLVRPVLISRITRSLLPPAARLLHLLGHADERPWHTWSWGPAALAPYTPRVIHRTTVLAPQRWLLPEALHDLAEHRDRWHRALDSWLEQAVPPVPQHVLIEESDRHLPIDLHQGEHRELLRRSTRRGCRTVAEVLAGAPPVSGPHGHHHLELVVPLRRTDPPSTAVLDPRTAARPRAADTVLPGDGWLSLALPAHPRHQDTILARLPAQPAELSYWLRYTTPGLGPHLRLRYRATPDALAALQRDLAGWARDLADQHLSSGHLTVLPYQRETQRYGGPDAITAAEEVFAADSALVLAALTGRPVPDDDQRLVLAALSAAAIARALRAPAATRPRPLSAASRRRRDALRASCRTATVPDRLTDTWQARQDALAHYRAHLTDETAPLCASDIIHLTCNRLLGPDRGNEQLARSLADDLMRRA